MRKLKEEKRKGIYSVTLDKDIVKRAKNIIGEGRKLSPEINDLLKNWVKEQESEKNKL